MQAIILLVLNGNKMLTLCEAASLAEFDHEEGLVVFDGLGVLEENLHDAARDLALDFVKELHGLDDADGLAGGEDARHSLVVERQRAVVDEALEAVAEADDAEAVLGDGRFGHGADDGVEPGAVAPAGEQA